ncbi:hypothetical protein D6817_04685 [Candidatus Pacearchaeota archaeon]|nr:MAG: hypothetical protein D6817_04685 [Candidatus Pacearchaeota archaeon]
MRKTLVALLGFGIAFGNGCYSGKSLPEIGFEQCSFKQSCEDFRIGVEPCETAEECEEMLGKNFLEHGILPFYLVIENRGESEALINGGFYFKDRNGERWEQVDWAELAKEEHRKAGLEALLAPGFLKRTLYFNAQSWNKKVDRTYKRLMINYNAHVKPGQTMRGFVAFRTPESALRDYCNSLAGSELYFYMQSEEIERFKFPLDCVQSNEN